MRDAHLQLVLVFAAVWVVLGAYSFVERDVAIAGVPLEKTEIKALLTDPADEEVADPLVDEPVAEIADTPEPRPEVSGAVSARPKAPKLPPLDETPQRIMIVGDSMVVNLIPPLADYCLENGHKLFPVIWYASTTVAWASQSKLNDVIREFRPTYVIMVLGSSELGVRNVKKRAQFVKGINKRIGKRHFFWLGPPNWRKDTGFNAMVEATVGKKHFFRSADIELERESDGIHPTPKAGRKWAALFAKWMATEAFVRIPMNEPTKKAIAPSAKVYPPPYEVREHYEKVKGKKKP